MAGYVAAVMTALFVRVAGRRGSLLNVLAFFSLVFLSSWAGGIWVRPVGQVVPPPVPWAQQLIVGFISALLMSSYVERAAVPARYERGRTAGR